MRIAFRVVLAVLVALGTARVCSAAVGEGETLRLKSPYLDVAVSLRQPALVSLALDGLGEGKIDVNALRPLADVPSAAKQPPLPSGDRPPAAGDAYLAAHGQQSGATWIEYRRPGTPADASPGWRFEVGDREIRLISQWSETEKPPPVVLDFDAERCHVTLLGLMDEDRDHSVRLPALLTLPGQGSLRISGAGAEHLSVDYDATREFTKVTFPAASRPQPRLEYRLEAVAIHPALDDGGNDRRLDGFRCNWLAVLQLNPRVRLLANNSGSDAAVICMYEYADIAAHTPPLADGLTALDVVRQSVERYLAGAASIGVPGAVCLDGTVPYWSLRPAYSDAHPSLLIAAADCAQGPGGEEWLRRQYPGIKRRADTLLATDHDGNGLLEYPASGNSDPLHRPNPNVSNWWDCIGFGHEDAYGNALAYRALREMASLAKTMGKSEDAARYTAAADKLHDVYYKTFYNPASGVLAGWKSADGKLHDYYFLFVNGIAIHYGLVPKDKANAIMDRLLAKMKEVGFTRFDLGLPGNLVPIPQDDYFEPRPSYGGGGAKGFQHYENGGATACFAYFTLAALYDLGRREEADRMLFPMLASFAKGGFEGRAPTGRSYDWKDWHGTPCGYEGFLSDNYYALLAVLARENRLRPAP